MDKFFECDDAGFFEAIHSSADFEVYVSVGSDGEFLFVHDFIGYKCAVDAEVLSVLHWGAEVEFVDVNAHVVGLFVCIRYGTVNLNVCV